MDTRSVSIWKAESAFQTPWDFSPRDGGMERRAFRDREGETAGGAAVQRDALPG